MQRLAGIFLSPEALHRRGMPVEMSSNSPCDLRKAYSGKGLHSSDFKRCERRSWKTHGQVTWRWLY